MSDSFSNRSHPWLALIVFIVLMSVSVGVFTRTETMVGYLASFNFWLQMVLGAIAIHAIHNLTGGKWGVLIRPFLLWTVPTLNLLAILFIPVLLMLTAIYPWAAGGRAVVGPGTTRQFFLSPVLFDLRSVLYFICFIFFARRLRTQETEGRMKVWSGLTLIAYLFVGTFACLDWIESIDRSYSATGFGAVYAAGALCSGFALAIVMTLRKERRVALEVGDELPLLGDLGNLLLMSLMLWAYLDFTQYLINWSGQLPREIRWYEERSSIAWSTAIAVTFAFHFAIPFVALLFRRVKRSPGAMLAIAVSVLISQWLENLLWCAPSAGLSFHRAIVPALAAAGLISVLWLFIYGWQERREPKATYRQIAIEVGR